uniref:Uncharacterized protein n=1 Tax=Magallana gigas TaxID=29159 RepID=K1QKA7_MAGGI
MKEAAIPLAILKLGSSVLICMQLGTGFLSNNVGRQQWSTVSVLPQSRVSTKLHARSIRDGLKYHKSARLLHSFGSM